MSCFHDLMRIRWFKVVACVFISGNVLGKCVHFKNSGVFSVLKLL